MKLLTREAASALIDAVAANKVTPTQQTYLRAMDLREPAWEDMPREQQVAVAMQIEVDDLVALVRRPLQAVPVEPPPPEEPPPWLEVDGSAAKVVDITKPKRPLKSRSYLSLVTILETPHLRRRILGDRAIEWDEMAQVVTIARKPIRDVDISVIRAEIERCFQGDADGNGMRFAVEDVSRAVEQVAHQSPFHPVREYLEGLEWDGVERLRLVPADILRAEDSPINRALIRRFFISAVARALSPGCKVDTVLILTGPQAARKSTFFAVLAGDWFSDEVVDIHNKDAFLTMASTWIHEWSELETMARARDVDALKAFLSKRIDSYRPPYGRSIVRVPRSCVIVGTTNRAEFLSDETGERRYWPVTVGSEIDIDTLRSIRDQLWAEAVAAYRAGEQWWLTREEGAELAAVHARHVVTDAWTELISDWMADRDGTALAPPTTGEVLHGALDKPVGQWTRGDEMRVAKILSRLGYVRKPGPRDTHGRRRWTWVRRVDPT